MSSRNDDRRSRQERDQAFIERHMLMGMRWQSTFPFREGPGWRRARCGQMLLVWDRELARADSEQE
jgi:hypothetical protein